jgi:hypothetical protein
MRSSNGSLAIVLNPKAKQGYTDFSYLPPPPQVLHSAKRIIVILQRLLRQILAVVIFEQRSC